MRQKEAAFSSSSPILKCQSSLTVHQCSSTMAIPYGTTTSIPMFNKNSIREKSPSRFSYLIRPIAPCILGTEIYDDKLVNDDEFFLTAGGIVHSCPNIYELLINDDCEHRQCQSCDHFMFIHEQTTSINTQLNTYDTEFNRYSILPRFQPISSSLRSTDSINSEIELYKERHAFGLSRNYQNAVSMNSSLLPKIWKSDNYLLCIPALHRGFSLSTSIDTNKRSHSNNIPIRQIFTSRCF
ncbi:unnamed protein product [Rotaria magnacalcarata]|uniref:Uncharacterized protein n=3 Tax=Rotaria magnacalcarata TaxID=392030 RepID=A0A814H1T8_9BILA|nr:unnamed protein product [Rotaria magnacalcarata]CAF1601022.1 unnamed protein product [Rotaria magnacalcarata]CAF2190858.1 unnamed protein product [Rotaria magnacalcarata]CAF3856193.1 unnamed protein product [Rotaria magnacalcarata]CAF4070722.1 unnamed protein product [Rotaria magnacalcarata]